MPRYKIKIEYVGTDFCGWQKQNNGLSIQATIEESIFKFSQERVTLYAAGRTDAGVHATGQVAHFDLCKEFNPVTVINAINYYLTPHLIGIQECEIVNNDFHARFSALKRHYVYRIINRVGKVIIDNKKVWWIKDELDIGKMVAASKHLIGKHDFTSFRATHCQSKSPVKNLDKIEIVKDNQDIKIFYTAPSFLHHMVRNITGTLVYAGLGKIKVEQVAEILAAKDRSKAPATAPACGLYFIGVEY